MSINRPQLNKLVSDRAISEYERLDGLTTGDEGVDIDALRKWLKEYAQTNADRITRPQLEAIRRKRNGEVGGAIAVLVASLVFSGVSSVVVQTATVVGVIAFLVWLVSALWRAGSRGADAIYDAYVAVNAATDAAMEDLSAYLTAKVARIRGAVMEERASRGTPPPDPQPFGVSHEGAENLVATWMKHLGAVDSEVTQFTGDGGIDVVSSMYIAQVKNYTGSVGVAEVRELAGVAAVDGRTPLFFTSGTYADGAATFASAAGIALFIYRAVEGTLLGANEAGRQAVSTGLEWSA